MKLPKIRMKTRYWKEKDLNEWQNRVEKLAFTIVLFMIVNISYIIFNDLSKIILGIDTIALILGIIITISYNQRNKERDDEDEDNDNNDRNRQESERGEESVENGNRSISKNDNITTNTIYNGKYNDRKQLEDTNGEPSGDTTTMVVNTTTNGSNRLENKTGKHRRRNNKKNKQEDKESKERKEDW